MFSGGLKGRTGAKRRAARERRKKSRAAYMRREGANPREETYLEMDRHALPT